MLKLTFGFIVAVLVLTAVSTAVMSRHTERRIDELGGNALESIRLLGQMGLDLERQQRLIEAHIFSASPRERAPIEQQIAAVQADYVAAARAYESMAFFPGEAQAWQRLHADVARLQAPMRDAMMLSTHNQDDAARAELRSIAPQIEIVERDINASIEINARQARETRRAIHRLFALSLLYRVFLWIIGICVTIAAAIRVTRTLARVERREHAVHELLEQRNRELDAFAGRVAHDLRGPLTAISASAELMMLRAPTDSREATRVHSGALRMKAIVEDLLQLAQIETVAPTDACDPLPAVAEVQERIAGQLAAVHGTIHVDVADARVRCRAGLLLQVIANLVENALKYRRPDVAPEIRISGHRAGEHYELRVRDNGIGMSDDEVRHAFESLFRARRVPGVPGTGLGLSIVKRIVEASGGTVALESKLGEGTTFIVRLPFAAGEA